MKLSIWQSLAASSLLFAALAARAATRPAYGGTLNVSLRETFTSLDPADTTQPDSFARRNLARLIFETLTQIDENGRVQPGLVTSWQEISGNKTWQFHVRAGVTFHDGTPLTAAIVADSLRSAKPPTSWKITSAGDSVVIECDVPDAFLPNELALTHYAIALRSNDGKLSGTGPFHIVEWQAGKKLSLAAEENYWAGRPFLDAIEIEFGRNFHEQQIALEMGKADLIEVPAEQSHRISTAGHQQLKSEPVELVALVFSQDAQSPEEKSLRKALGLSLDRTSMGNVMLQGASTPAASILPQWMSGYSFAFATDADVSRARHMRQEVQAVPRWTISYDAGDPMAALIAQRVMLNARDAGLQIEAAKGATADLRIMRIPLPNDAIDAVNMVAATVGISMPEIKSENAEDIYSAEETLLATEQIIPLFHLPVVYEASSSVKGEVVRANGDWDLADAWLIRRGVNP